MKTPYFFVVAVVLLMAGIGMMSVPHLGPEPEYTCLEEGQPSSGFSIEVDGQECVLSSSDFKAYWEYEHRSARPVRLAGLGVAVLGIGTCVAGIVVGVRRRKKARLLA